MYIWYVNPPCGGGDGDYSDIHPFQSLMSHTCSEFATLPQNPQNRVEPGWKVITISNIWISGGASPVLGCWMPPSSPVESYSRRNLEKQLGRNNHTPTFHSLFGKPTLQLFSPKVKVHDLNHNFASSDCVMTLYQKVSQNCWCQIWPQFAKCHDGRIKVLQRSIPILNYITNLELYHSHPSVEWGHWNWMLCREVEA